MPAGFTNIDPDDPFENFAGPLYQKDGSDGLVYGFCVRSEHCNAGDICHGGMLMTFADYAMCSAAIHGHNANPITITMNSEFMAPVQEGDRVLARCEIQRRTSSMVFCRADLVVGEQAVAAFTGVIKRLKPRN